MKTFKEYFLENETVAPPTNTVGTGHIAGTTVSDPPAGTDWILNKKVPLKRKDINIPVST